MDLQIDETRPLHELVPSTSSAPLRIQLGSAEASGIVENAYRFSPIAWAVFGVLLSCNLLAFAASHGWLPIAQGLIFPLAIAGICAAPAIGLLTRPHARLRAAVRRMGFARKEARSIVASAVRIAGTRPAISGRRARIDALAAALVVAIDDETGRLNEVLVPAAQKELFAYARELEAARTSTERRSNELR